MAQNNHLPVPDRDTVMRHETWRNMETRDRDKTRRTSVETEPRPIHEISRLKTVSSQDTCLETASLVDYNVPFSRYSELFVESHKFVILPNKLICRVAVSTSSVRVPHGRKLRVLGYVHRLCPLHLRLTVTVTVFVFFLLIPAASTDVTKFVTCFNLF